MVAAPGGGRRVAFFGGSFDPPHRGHLGIARAAQLALDLDTVLFAPVGAQPLKPLGATASFADRLAMTELAIKDEPGFDISLADAPAPDGAQNYTFDTLLSLRRVLPANTALFCLMGADSFLALHHWRRGADIPFVASLIVASRPGEHLEDLTAVLPTGLSIEAARTETSSSDGVEMRTFTLRNGEGVATPLYILPGLEIEISASKIRQQAHDSHSSPCAGRDPLPEAVCEYIVAHQLYL